MKTTSLLPAICISAMLLTGLFYQQGIGLNLLIFDTLFIIWLFITKQIKLQTANQIISVSGFLVTSIFTVVTYSIYAYVIHFLALFVFVGMLNYNQARSFITALAIAFVSILSSQAAFVQEIYSRKIHKNAFGKLLWKSRIFLVPVLIITVFVSIYSFSNNVFGSMVGDVGLFIQNGFIFVFERLNFSLIFTFIFCSFSSVFLIIRSKNTTLAQQDAGANEQFMRHAKKNKRYFRLTALKSEYKAGAFLLLVLNALILIANTLDIYWVWFNFEWVGQTLKQFVHEGTYLLILSILISIALVLYFFRGNLNFYKRNKFLKLLSYIWLGQNAVLAISVMIRNYWYIEYFALAYKRIGVLIFLTLTVYGLYTVLIKIRDKKSAFYLFRTNAIAVFVALVLTSAVPWDSLIAQFNFAHANQSYLHLEYLSKLSDKTLPALDRSAFEMTPIETFQKETFDIDHDDMTYGEYRIKINTRTASFKEKWEAKNILSWNLPEYLAYKSFAK